jgi:hypothetical protein
MEIHRQQCQKCQAYDTRNILVREEGQPQTVFVRCGQCGEFVARYVLSDYYHHGRGFESFLRSQQVGVAESGRDLMHEFKRIQEDALTGYQHVLDELERLGKA